MAERLVDVDALLKLALLLAALLLALELSAWVTAAFTRSLRPVFAIVLVLVLLWYTDRI